MKKSANRQDSESVVTFVQEGMTHAVNFEDEPSRRIAAIDVSQCHLLEISNRGADKKRTVMSLSHFMIPHLRYERNLNKSLELVIDNFIAQGGVAEGAQFRIYGGVEIENTELRNALKESILRIIPTANIEEPKGHEVKRASRISGESIDYIFDRDCVTFRKATLSGEDVVSANLKSNGKLDEDKVVAHQSFLTDEWSRVSQALGFQSGVIEEALVRGKAILDQISEQMDEIVKDPRKIREAVKSIESQVIPMSLKVCDRNGLMEGLKALETTRLDGKSQGQENSHA